MGQVGLIELMLMSSTTRGIAPGEVEKNLSSGQIVHNEVQARGILRVTRGYVHKCVSELVAGISKSMSTWDRVWLRYANLEGVVQLHQERVRDLLHHFALGHRVLHLRNTTNG